MRLGSRRTLWVVLVGSSFVIGDPFSPQEALGHKSIAMTVRYAHLAPHYQLAAAEKLDEAYPGTTTAGLSDTGIETAPVSQPQPGSARVN